MSLARTREILRAKAEEVRQELSGIDGLVDLRTIGDVEEPQVRIKVDLEAASDASVKPGEVRRSAATVFSGLNVGFLFEDQKIFDVVVWSPPEARQSLNDLEDVLVERTDRHYVRLADIADVDIVSVPAVIKHSGVAPYIDVVANVNGRDVGSVTEDVEQRLQNVDFPLEYYPEILGEYVERKGVERRILGVAIAALIGIFLLLQACFRSLALGLHRVSRLAGLGRGRRAGRAGQRRGGLAGVHRRLPRGPRHCRTQRHSADHPLSASRRSGRYAIRSSTRDPRRPRTVLAHPGELGGNHRSLAGRILFFGLIPGLEIVQPTAIVIIGGLVASTLVTLFVLPALYLVVGARADRQLDLGTG